MRRVVLASANHWGSPVTTGSQQYARRFVEAGWRAAYISDPVSPYHLVRPQSWLYNRYKFGLWARGGEWHLDDRLYTYNPMSLLPVFDAPVLRSRTAVRRALDLTVPSLRRKLTAVGFERPDLLWIDHLTFEGLVDRVSAGATLYRLADDPALFPGPYPPALLERFPRLLRRVDAVIATGRRLAEQALEERDDDRVLYLPNGVDFEHFAVSGPEPSGLEGIPRPRAVYVGSLEPWFDTDLLARAARQRQSLQFVIVGPVRVDLRPLTGLRNVHILGPRPYAEVPAYMAHSDVGIIPFRTTDAMQAVHPIKVYEYLAAGLPVVSTDWAELAAIGAPIERVTDVEGFVNALDRAAEGGAPGDPSSRREFAGEHSWAARFDTLIAALDGWGLL